MGNDAGPGNLTRTSSQPMSHLPRYAPGTNGALNRRPPYVPEGLPYPRHSSASLIDLSFDNIAIDPPSEEKSRVPHPDTFRDLITF